MQQVYTTVQKKQPAQILMDPTHAHVMLTILGMALLALKLTVSVELSI